MQKDVDLVAMDYIRFDWRKNKGKGTYLKNQHELAEAMNMSFSAIQAAFARAKYTPSFGFILRYCKANQIDEYMFLRMILSWIKEKEKE